MNRKHKKNNAFFSAISIYVGAAVGAGIFGIPYAMSRFGFVPSLLYMVFLTVAVVCVNLFYGEVVLRTKESHQMAGYAEKYIGKWGKRVVLFALVFGVYGAIVAYTIGVGGFLFELLGPILGGTPLYYSLGFFTVMSLVIYAGLRTVAGMEAVLSGLFVLVTGVIIALGLPHIDTANLATFHPENFFLPYGVILFALGAMTTVPLMKEVLEPARQLKRLKKAILIGSAIPLVIYLAFAVVVVGVTGGATSEEGIIGLGRILGDKVLVMGAIFGILTMSTSFLALGFILKEMYEFDYKVPRFWSWILVCSVPLAIFLTNFAGFIGVLGIVGSVTGGLEGIIMILMWRKARKVGDREPEYRTKVPQALAFSLMGIFALGIAYQVWHILKG